MSRKMIGVSESLHTDLSEIAKAAGVPMTLVLETLLAKADEVSWPEVKSTYQENKPSWKNIRKSIVEYREKYPDADDAQLAAYTGYSVNQVEVITHSAHKRCLTALAKKQMKPDQLAKTSKVSAKFAKRIWDQYMGVARIPAQELYLWDTTGQTPIPHTCYLAI